MQPHEIRSRIGRTDIETALMEAYGRGGQAGFHDVARAVGGPAAASRAARDLIYYGLIEPERSEADEITLNAAGAAIAEDIAKSRLSGSDRRAAVQKGVLRWLSDGATPGDVAEFVGTERARSGQIPFTQEEVLTAASALDEWRLIKTTKAYGGHLLRPRITHEGREAADDPRTPYEFVRQGGSITYNTSTTNIGDSNTIGGVQTGGSQNTQTVTQTMSVDQRAQVLGLVGGLLATLDEAEGETGDLRAAVEDIKAEAASDHATRDSLKSRVVQALVTAGASESGHLIAQGLAHLLGVVTA